MGNCVAVLSYHASIRELVGNLAVRSIFDRSWHLWRMGSSVVTITTSGYDGPLGLRVSRLPRVGVKVGTAGRLTDDGLCVGPYSFPLGGARPWNPLSPEHPLPVDWCALDLDLTALWAQMRSVESCGSARSVEQVAEPPGRRRPPAGGGPPLGAAPTGPMSTRTAVADGRDALREALIRLDRAAITAAVTSLIGLGPGLTPSGDDLLCGLLAGLSVFGARCPELSCRCIAARKIVNEIVAANSHRTTALSRTLLEQAGRGVALQPLLDVLWCVGTGRVAAVSAPLLAVGHSSGSDLLSGALLAGSTARSWRDDGSPLAHSA